MILCFIKMCVCVCASTMNYAVTAAVAALEITKYQLGTKQNLLLSEAILAVNSY
jgi:hypothetical protein